MTMKTKALTAGGGLLIIALAMILIVPGCTTAQDERAINETITEAYADLSTRNAQPERVVAACEAYLTPEFRNSLYFCTEASTEVGFGGGTYAIRITAIETETNGKTAESVVYFDNDTADASYSKWSNAVRLVKNDGEWRIAYACSKNPADIDPRQCLESP